MSEVLNDSPSSCGSIPPPPSTTAVAMSTATATESAAPVPLQHQQEQSQSAAPDEPKREDNNLTASIVSDTSAVSGHESINSTASATSNPITPNQPSLATTMQPTESIIHLHLPPVEGINSSSPPTANELVELTPLPPAVKTNGVNSLPAAAKSQPSASSPSSSPNGKAIGIFKHFEPRSPPPTLNQYAHILSVADLEHGLTSVTVEKQRLQFGWNESVEKQMPMWQVFALKFWGATPFMIMLTMAISFGLSQWVDGGVITILLVINGIIAFHEDVRARKAVAELMKKLQVMVRVHREDHWSELPSRELVPGDVIRIRTGDIVGADVVLLDGQVSVDQSALTGESALKSMIRDSIVYAGSIIKRGEADAVVIAIGNATFFGKTARLVQSSKPSVHMDRIIRRVVVVLMSVVIATIIATIIVLAVSGKNVLDVIPLLLMIIISALPVALPAMFTVSLALGSKELSERSVLITRLHVLEDAAMMSILFSDKTGTLTQNILSIQEIQKVDFIHPQRTIATTNDTLLAAALCSRRENSDPIDLAILDAYEKQSHEFSADAANKSEMIMFPEMNMKHYETLQFVPFDFSLRRTEALVRYSSSSVSNSSNPSTGGPIPRQYCRVAKGAVATLATLSGLSDKSEEWKHLQDMIAENAKHGYRTIAVARQILTEQEMNAIVGDPSSAVKKSSDESSAKPVTPVHISTPFELLGLIVLFDPPRPDSGKIIQELKELGITTKMLTGDATGVACEIGGQVGLGREFINLEKAKAELKVQLLAQDAKKVEKEVHIDMQVGDDDAKAKAKEAEQEKLDERILTQLLQQYDPLQVSGFAQIYPADKHRIVKQTQTKGYICGMTGDGVNDAPALKQAEVGCAMANATDVAKGSASVVFLSPGLSGVVEVVKVGRQVHRRVEVWVMMKVAKACKHSVFILVMFMITGKFPITALAVILLLLLMDFVLVSISTDHQEPGSKPQTWNLIQLTRIGLVVGLLGAGEMMAIIFTLQRHLWDGSDDANMTLAFLCMYFWGMLAIFNVREKRAFYASRPSNVLFWVVVVETIIVWIVCAMGIPSANLVGIGWGYASTVIGIGLGSFLLNDWAKVLWIKHFEKDY